MKDFYANIEVDSKVNERQRHIQRERYKERVRKRRQQTQSQNDTEITEHWCNELSWQTHKGRIRETKYNYKERRMILIL